MGVPVDESESWGVDGKAASTGDAIAGVARGADALRRFSLYVR